MFSSPCAGILSLWAVVIGAQEEGKEQSPLRPLVAIIEEHVVDISFFVDRLDYRLLLRL